MEHEKANRLLAQGQRIRKARRAKGMTQTDLAVKCGYTDWTTIHKIEKGLQRLPAHRLDDLCKALDVTPEYILTSDDDLAKTYKEIDLLISQLKMAADSLTETVYELAQEITDALEKIKNAT